jgi:hypothetical protein
MISHDPQGRTGWATSHFHLPRLDLALLSILVMTAPAKAAIVYSVDPSSSFAWAYSAPWYCSCDQTSGGGTSQQYLTNGAATAHSSFTGSSGGIASASSTSSSSISFSGDDSTVHIAANADSIGAAFSQAGNQSEAGANANAESTMSVTFTPTVDTLLSFSAQLNATTNISLGGGGNWTLSGGQFGPIAFNPSGSVTEKTVLLHSGDIYSLVGFVDSYYQVTSYNGLSSANGNGPASFTFGGTFTAAPVPVPPTSLFFLSGLGGLGVIVRLRQPAQSVSL